MRLRLKAGYSRQWGVSTVVGPHPARAMGSTTSDPLEASGSGALGLRYGSDFTDEFPVSGLPSH